VEKILKDLPEGEFRTSFHLLAACQIVISSAAFTLLPRVEVVVPTGKVTTIQIEDTYLIANLHFTDPVTITFKSYIVDLFIFSSANVTLNGTLSSLGLIVDAASTIFDGYFLFDNLTAGIKSASGNNNTGFVLDFKICGALQISIFTTLGTAAKAVVKSSTIPVYLPSLMPIVQLKL
jgi:hypothetical protein